MQLCLMKTFILHPFNVTFGVSAVYTQNVSAAACAVVSDIEQPSL